MRSIVLNAPNVLSLVRLGLAPLVVWFLFQGRMLEALIALVVAAASDGVDGFLARRYGWHTELGAALDAIADKLLLIGTYLALGYLGELPGWLVALVVSRDLILMGAVLLRSLLHGPVRIRPLLAGKVNTAAQVILAIIVIADEGLQLGLGGLRGALHTAIAATTVVSALAYFKEWLSPRRMAESDGGDRRTAGR